ncbi:MAG: transposon-transfer assisting family protein [Oscillospiraceae bacterium]|nr:transposon-transfer assisting family protein [Oscillospiraceae bacterium]
MDNDIFTVEEENFLCIFDISGRGALIQDIAAAVPYFDDPEMRVIAETILRKLDGMTDAEFSALIFSPIYYNDETEV